MSTLRIGIAGAGLLGRLLAWHFSRQGHEVHVYDPAPHARPAHDGHGAAGFTAAGMLSPLAELETAEPALAALGQVDDRVMGLRAGGDDYLAKPYAFSELLARVEALARRKGGSGGETLLKVADLEVDRLARRVTRAGKDIDVQPREFRLLEYLLRHAGQVVTRTMLLENVWDYHFDPQTNVIDVHMSRLRAKIDRGFSSSLIHTIRGAGYMIRDPSR